MGTGATNPLTLDWLDNVHLLLKTNSEAGSNHGARYYTKENASNKPYLEITYTPAPPEEEAQDIIWWD
jgi:hypothetical protein